MGPPPHVYHISRAFPNVTLAAHHSCDMGIHLYPRSLNLGQVLKLLARNVEANLHLFAENAPPIDGFNSNTAVVVGNGSPPKGGSGGSGGSGETESTGGCGKEASREENRKEVGSSPGVVAVRKLDWFAFSPREGPTDAAICCSSAKDNREVRA